MFSYQQPMSQQITENNSTNASAEGSPDKSICGVKRQHVDINSSDDNTDLLNLNLINKTIADGQAIHRGMAVLAHQFGEASEWAANAQKNQQLLSTPPSELQVLEDYDRSGKFKKVTLLNGQKGGSRVTKFLLCFHQVHPDPYSGDAQMIRDALLAQLTNAILFPSN